MRAYLIDATIQTITPFDYVDGTHEPEEIIGGVGRGDFELASGPLTPTLDDSVYREMAGDTHLADYLYARADLHFVEISPDVDGTPDIEGDPKCWFQIDAGLGQPTTFPIPGRGLVIGVTLDGTWCDAQLNHEELTRRVAFTRRKLRGFTMSTAIIKGEFWTGPVAPIIDGF